MRIDISPTDIQHFIKSSQATTSLAVQTDNRKLASELSIPEANYLSPREIKDLHTRTNKARLTYIKVRDKIDQVKDKLKDQLDAEQKQKLINLSNHFKHLITKHYFQARDGSPDYLTRHQEIFNQIIEDSRIGDFQRTRKLFALIKPNFLLSFFQIPYNKDLKKESLELITFEERPIDPELRKHYPSEAVSVQNLKTSPGFSNEIAVALFPENFLVRNKADKDAPDCKAYYLIEKFITRMFKYTFPVIDKNVESKDFFKPLLRAKREALREAVSSWLSTHEYFHSQGPLPRVFRGDRKDPNNINKVYSYYLKDTAETGALEELRVDLNGILETGSAKLAFGDENGNIAAALVFSERLLRYPLQEDPSKNFDAISSHILLNFLEANDALTIDDQQGIIRLKDNETIRSGLKALKNTVDELETDIDKKYDLSKPEELEAAKNEIKAFVREWARKHKPDSSKYTLRPVYKKMRESIQSNFNKRVFNGKHNSFSSILSA